jgi:DNA uptake protein ComE-like DNA-binding protein
MFAVKSDLLKLYGMDSAFYMTLVPHINLPEKREVKGKPHFEKKPKIEPVAFDLNRADTTQLTGIKGIGKILAARIIKYRESLGGFIVEEQIREVYGLDSAVIDRLIKQSFVEQGFRPRQLNVNTAGENQLSAHPYISKTHSRAIVAYRFQHGGFQSVDELRKIFVMDDKSFNKAIPYLTVE